MNIPGLTRDHVASHLQKYKRHMKSTSNGATQQQNEMKNKSNGATQQQNEMKSTSNGATQHQNEVKSTSNEMALPNTESWSSSDCTKENLSPPAPNHSSKKTAMDAEIEAIEHDALRLKKAKRVMGRVVPARYMLPRPNAVVSRKPEEMPKAKVKISNNNNNNNSSWRRGMSLGPAEIAATVQSRRKSCFSKLPEIKDEAV